MKDTFTPLNDRILVKPDDAVEQIGAIVLAKKDKPSTATVVAVSPEVRQKAIVVGAKVMYGKHAGVSIPFNGEQHLILRESELFGII